jgi:hypothetical protein
MYRHLLRIDEGLELEASDANPAEETEEEEEKEEMTMTGNIGTGTQTRLGDEPYSKKHGKQKRFRGKKKKGVTR